MRLLFVLLMVGVSLGAFHDVTTPNSFSSGTPALASEVNENYDSTRIPVNKNFDTVEVHFVRFSDFESGDSTLSRFQADTLSVSDSAFATRLRTTYGTVDTLTSNKITVSATDVGMANADTFAIGVQDVTTYSRIVQKGDGTINLASGAIDLIDPTDTTFLGIEVRGPVACSTLNTGQGANELYDMNQNVLTTSDVTFDSLYLSDALNVTNQADIGGAVSVGSLASVGAITGTTLNTGQGANELYAMDQAVQTTDDVTFGDVTVDTIKAYHGQKIYSSDASNLQISATNTVASGTIYAQQINPNGGNKYLGTKGSRWKLVCSDSVVVGDIGTTGFHLYGGWYQDTAYACTLTTNVSTTISGLVDSVGFTSLVRIGNLVTATFSGFAFNAAASGGTGALTMSPDIPTSYRPGAGSGRIVAAFRSSSNDEVPYIEVQNDGDVLITMEDGEDLTMYGVSVPYSILEP